MFHWQVTSRLAKLADDPGVVLPVRQCRQRPFTPIYKSLGANDEHFRKNHERDLRHQGGRRSRPAAARPRAPARPVEPLHRPPQLSTSRRSSTRRSKAKGEKLEWRTSIVDLMKALDIDSSFAARKELAKELGYTGDSNDSASMNIWLHKQVMTKLAANGGKLPPDIKH